MRSGTKCNPRIDLDHDVIWLRIFHRLPCWFDDNIIIETDRMEELLPVVHPVFVLCIRECYILAAYRYKRFKAGKLCSYIRP